MYIHTYIRTYTLVQGAGHYSTAQAALALLLKGLCVCVPYITVKWGLFSWLLHEPLIGSQIAASSFRQTEKSSDKD